MTTASDDDEMDTTGGDASTTFIVFAGLKLQVSEMSGWHRARITVRAAAPSSWHFLPVATEAAFDSFSALMQCPSPVSYPPLSCRNHNDAFGDADVLLTILLFTDPSSLRDMLSFRSVSRTWHRCVAVLPQWGFVDPVLAVAQRSIESASRGRRRAGGLFDDEDDDDGVRDAIASVDDVAGWEASSMGHCLAILRESARRRRDAADRQERLRRLLRWEPRLVAVGIDVATASQFGGSAFFNHWLRTNWEAGFAAALIAFALAAGTGCVLARRIMGPHSWGAVPAVRSARGAMYLMTLGALVALGPPTFLVAAYGQVASRVFDGPVAIVSDRAEAELDRPATAYSFVALQLNGGAWAVSPGDEYRRARVELHAPKQNTTNATLNGNGRAAVRVLLDQCYGSFSQFQSAVDAAKRARGGASTADFVTLRTTRRRPFEQPLPDVESSGCEPDATAAGQPTPATIVIDPREAWYGRQPSNAMKTGWGVAMHVLGHLGGLVGKVVFASSFLTTVRRRLWLYLAAAVVVANPLWMTVFAAVCLAGPHEESNSMTSTLHFSRSTWSACTYMSGDAILLLLFVGCAASVAFIAAVFYAGWWLCRDRGWDDWADPFDAASMPSDGQAW